MDFNIYDKLSIMDKRISIKSKRINFIDLIGYKLAMMHLRLKTKLRKNSKSLRSGDGIPVPSKNASLYEKILYWIALFSGLGLLGTIIAAIGIIVIFTFFSSVLPSPTRLTNRPIEESTKIYDRNGELLYSVYDEKNRTLIKISDLSTNLVNATLATEDAEFYKHGGIDSLGILRSVYKTLIGSTQGGSTLTQQIARTALLTMDRTLARKVKEVVMALQIENTYSKEDILQMYFNEIPYVGSTWGVEAASKSVFNKSGRDLTLGEAALIAGLPQGPTRYNPFIHPDEAEGRRKYVLHLMRSRGWVDKDGHRQYISQDEYDAAIAEKMVYAEEKGVFRAPHFVMYVLDLLRNRYGDDMVAKGGLRVTTSLDIGIQEEYQQIVKEEVDKASAAGLQVGNGALVAIEPKSRSVIAMVGSKDYYADDYDGQYNVALSPRQPGSTLKPITYLTGLKQGYTASTVLYDVYTEFSDKEKGSKKYAPQNYGSWGFRGPLQIRYALPSSVNVTAVKMLDLVGIQNMVKTANDLGLKSLVYNPSRHGLAITLGGVEVTLLELTNAFASLADKGVYKDVSPILEVTTRDGSVLEKASELDGTQAVDARLAWIISDILSDNNARSAAFGSKSQLYIPGQKVAVKTGTTNDMKDNWTVGYTGDLAIGVWVGNNDNSPMNNRLASGLTGASPIWNRAFVRYLKDHPHTAFERPEGIVETWVGTISGMVPYDGLEEKRLEYFVEGTQPKAKSDIFKRVKICKDGKIKDKEYVEYQDLKEEWQPFLEEWIKNKYKDDESQLFIHMGPDYEKDKESDRFDLDKCEDNNDDD